MRMRVILSFQYVIWTSCNVTQLDFFFDTASLMKDHYTDPNQRVVKIIWDSKDVNYISFFKKER